MFSRSFTQIYPLPIHSNGVSIPSSAMRVVMLGDLHPVFFYPRLTRFLKGHHRESQYKVISAFTLYAG